MDNRLGREQSLWVLGLVRACTQEGGGGGGITAAATTEAAAAAAVATEAYGSVLIGQTFAVGRKPGEEPWLWMASWVQQIDPFLPADSHFVFSFRTIFPARPIIEPGHVLALWNQSAEVQPPASHAAP